MDEGLDGLTLAGWAAGVWYKHRRGVVLTGHEGAIVYCMEHHTEWRSRWDSLGSSIPRCPAMCCMFLMMRWSRCRSTTTSRLKYGNITKSFAKRDLRNSKR